MDGQIKFGSHSLNLAGLFNFCVIDLFLVALGLFPNSVDKGMTSPSYASMKDTGILGACVNTNVVINEFILDAFTHMYARKVDGVYEECAATAINFVNNKTRDAQMRPCNMHEANDSTLSGLFGGFCSTYFLLNLLLVQLKALYLWNQKYW